PVQRPEGWGERGVMLGAAAKASAECIQVRAYNSKP
ncbi:MAG: hypothetical protein RL369_647, partial [Pseudomonadota bacterium]